MSPSGFHYHQLRKFQIKLWKHQKQWAQSRLVVRVLLEPRRLHPVNQHQMDCLPGHSMDLHSMDLHHSWVDVHHHTSGHELLTRSMGVNPGRA